MKLISQLPEPYKQLALKRQQECTQEYTLKTTDHIGDAFAWDLTPERYPFWYSVYVKVLCACGGLVALTVGTALKLNRITAVDFSTSAAITQNTCYAQCFLSNKFKSRIMAKQSFTHYYVQAQKEGEQPEIVHHTYDEEEKEYYYKFLDKKKAKALAEAEKKITPDVKFRVVKCVETYEPDAWF